MFQLFDLIMTLPLVFLVGTRSRARPYATGG